MLCPCGGKLDVIDSRLINDGLSVRRRRECLTCHKRTTTYETQDTQHLGSLNLRMWNGELVIDLDGIPMRRSHPKETDGE